MRTGNSFTERGRERKGEGERERVIKRAGLGLRESLGVRPHGQSLNTVIAKWFLT